MSKNFVQTMRNCGKFYQNSDHKYVAKMMDGEGYTAHISSDDRTFFVVTRVDKNASLVITEISPNIHCEREARGQFGEYISQINTNFKSGNIRIASNGNVYVQVEQHFDDAPLSVEMFEELETIAKKLILPYLGVLDKLAHMRLLNPEEADPDMVFAKHIKSKLSEHMERIARNPLSDDDDFLGKHRIDNDDDDDDDDITFGKLFEEEGEPTPKIPSFSELFEKRFGNKSPFDTSDDNDNDSHDSTETSCGDLWRELTALEDTIDDDCDVTDIDAANNTEASGDTDCTTEETDN